MRAVARRTRRPGAPWQICTRGDDEARECEERGGIEVGRWPLLVTLILQRWVIVAAMGGRCVVRAEGGLERRVVRMPAVLLVG